MDTIKIKLTISYDGSKYFGSQIQPDKVTVHSQIKKVFSILNIDTVFDFSGRTDKGVHAFKQVVSCSIPNRWEDLNIFKQVLNNMLPPSIFVRSIYKVSEDFHSRFSAKKREYRYLISTTKTNPFNCEYLSYFEKINFEKMEEIKNIFIGKYDFLYFSKTGSEPNSTIRTIFDIKIYKHKELYIIKFTADSYLRSQIRLMVQALVDLSIGKLTVPQIKEQLECKNIYLRKPAPANGLYLSKVIY